MDNPRLINYKKRGAGHHLELRGWKSVFSAEPIISSITRVASWAVGALVPDLVHGPAHQVARHGVVADDQVVEPTISTLTKILSK